MREMKKQIRFAGKKRVEEKGSSVPGEWLYLARSGMTVREIMEAVGDGWDVEFWEEAGVLEIALGEADSMDLEYTRIQPRDEITKSFAESHSFEEVFLVTFAPGRYEEAKVLMRKIQSQCGGLFCGDTEDFTPMLGV